MKIKILKIKDFSGNENVLHLSCDDGCTTLWTYWEKKHIEFVNFMICKLYLTKDGKTNKRISQEGI